MTSVLTKKINLIFPKFSFSTVFLGLISSFLFLSIFVGGPLNAVGVILVLIICTAGVGLLPLILLWLGVGLVMTWIIGFIKKLTQVKKKTEQAEQNKSKEQIALVCYITQARNNGMNDNNIFSILKKNGWAENVIHEAFGLVATHKES